MTHEEIARVVGTTRSRVTRTIGLLKLPEDLRDRLAISFFQGVSMGHAEEIATGYLRLQESGEAERAERWAAEMIDKAVDGGMSIQALREERRTIPLPVAPDTSIRNSPRKPLRRWHICGGKWQRFDTSSRGKVTLEFKLPDDIDHRDAKRIVRYIRQQLLTAPKHFEVTDNVVSVDGGGDKDC